MIIDRKRYRCVWSLVAAFSIVIAAMASGCLWGVVRDVETGAGLPGASVSYTNTEGQTVSTTTNDSGLYAFDVASGPVPPAGPLSLRLGAPGYGPLTQRRLIEYDDNPHATLENLSTFWEIQHVDLARENGGDAKITDVTMAVDMSDDGRVTKPPLGSRTYRIGDTFAVEVEAYNIPRDPGANALQVVLNSFADGSRDLMEPIGWAIDPNGSIKAQSGQACLVTGAGMVEVETAADGVRDQVRVPCFFTGALGVDYHPIGGDHVVLRVSYRSLGAGMTDLDLVWPAIFECKVVAANGSGNMLSSVLDAAETQ